MNEYLVEWALLKEINYLQNCISIPLSHKICQQYTTNYGRIDFAHRIRDNGILITELETTIDSKARICYCFEQVKSYKKIRFNNIDKHYVSLLYAQQTPTRYQKEISDFCNSNDIEYFQYDLERVKKIYEDEIEKSLINLGAPLVKPVAMNLTHLSSFNRLIIPFYKKNTTKLNKQDFKEYFEAINTDITETVFNVIVNGARYFDLLDITENNEFILTDYGIRFRDNINLIEVNNDVKRIELSLEQKRVLLESLLNGNFYKKKSKINLYYFLKFISITEGDWIPRGRKFDDKAKFDFVNSFLKTNYTEGVVADLLKFSCNHCIELGLVEKIRTQGYYDRAILTNLGSRVLNLLDMDLNLKREKIQIPLNL